jgi:hypothetical protein
MLRKRIAFNAAVVLVASLTGVGAQGQGAKKPAAPAAAGQAVTVHLTPTCGCCGKWVEHLKAAGFNVTTNVTTKLDAVPERQRVPSQLRTCHTAVVGPYLVEGHVPVDVIQKMLKEKPKVAGIAVPGMPIGSPGMEGPNPRPYSVVAFTADGATSEFARR